MSGASEQNWQWEGPESDTDMEWKQHHVQPRESVEGRDWQ